MKLGIIHLSDIHLRNGEFKVNADNEMAQAISAAVRTELIGTTHVLLIISGDIAFGGDEQEYNYAFEWFSDLYTRISESCNATCWIICCPGNHDVDHSEKRKIRTALIDKIRQDPELAKDRDIIDECTKEQGAFFAFREALEGDEILVHDDPLLRIHRLRDDDSIVQVNVFNTAWMSSLDEHPGSIVYPVESYRERLQKPDGFSISILHHPLSWFTTEHSRQMREELTSCSSVVMFGHEHVPDSLRLLTKFGDHVRILEGGVLREDDTNNSSFNLLLLDTHACRVKNMIFRRSDARYVGYEDTDWQDATRLTSSESGQFRLRIEARTGLEDMGANILHPRQDRLGLRDIFVYPDLLPVNTDVALVQEKIKQSISAETVLFSTDISHVLLEGEENSGKSALLRMYFLEFYQRGKIPLLIQGAKSTTQGGDELRSLIKRRYNETYSGKDYTQFEQLDPTERVLLIDNFEFEGNDKEAQEAFFNFVHQFAGKCVVVTKDLLALERYATTKTGSSALRQFNAYLVQEFGHVKRDELIKRWILLGRQTRDWNTPITLGERDHVRLIINTTIGRNLMPSFPIFLLIILQSTETAAQSSIGSTYGHYYQFLITRTLIESGVKPEDLDAYSNYISELAFNQYFSTHRKEVPKADYLTWHQSFCEDFGVYWEPDSLRATLVDANILAVEATGVIYFKYQYVYYFFLAKRLAMGIADESIRDSVLHMCDRLHIDEYANVILFLIHHSNDKFVLDSVQRSAKSLLNGQPQFGLDISPENALLDIVNRLPSPLGVQVLEDRDPDVEQDKALKNRDLAEANHRELEKTVPESDELKEQPMDGLDILAQAGVAAKTVELLGQILRNYYGSLRVGTKVELAEEAVDLSLRALYSFIDLLISDEVEIVKVLMEARREYELEHLKTSARKDERELERWARDFAFSVLRVVARAIVRKVASALGSDQLKPTLEKLVPEEASLAYKMVEIAALLDGPIDIPRDKIDLMAKSLKSNPLGFQILRDLVAQRVYRYPTDYTEKQWLSEKLNFSMLNQRSADISKSRRLLPG